MRLLTELKAIERQAFYEVNACKRFGLSNKIDWTTENSK